MERSKGYINFETDFIGVCERQRQPVINTLDVLRKANGAQMGIPEKRDAHFYCLRFVERLSISPLCDR